MTTPWLRTAEALPLMETTTDAAQKHLREVQMERAEYAALLQRHQGDLLLLSVVLIFLVGSYVTCRYCRCRWLHKRSSRPNAHEATDGHAYVTYTPNGSGQPPTKKKFVLESVTSSQAVDSTHPTLTVNRKQNTTTTKKKKAVLVSEMEQPFLGPPDYEQPPAYELSPPAYDYLPSAPPLSDDTEHSPKLP